MAEYKMSTTGRVPKAIRLSQHLDLDGQLEVLQLKTKLQEMTEMVQQLLLHLSALEKLPGFLARDSPKKGSVATQTNVQDEQQSAAVREKMSELVGMNLNWQKYNALQEKHIRELNDKVEQLTQQLQQQNNNEQQLQQNVQLKQIEELQKENLQLKNKLEKLTLVLNNLSTGSSKGQDTESQILKETEREQLMAAQLMMYKEDFEMERKDREKAQSRIVELETELIKLRKQSKSSPGFYGTNSDSPSTDEFYLQNDCSLSKLQLNEKTTINLDEDLAMDSSDCVASSFAARNLGSRADQRFGTAGNLKQDVLCCPKCFKVFLMQEHSELLDHIELCPIRHNRKPVTTETSRA